MGFSGEGPPDHGDAVGLGPDTISMTPINLCQLPYPDFCCCLNLFITPHQVAVVGEGVSGLLDIGSFGSIEQRHHDLQG